MVQDFQDRYGRLASLPLYFVGGLPRSGTTWVQQLLNAHSQLLCLGESHFFNDLVPRLRGVVSAYGQRRAESRDTWAPTVRGPGPEALGPMMHAAFIALVQANLEGRRPEDLVALGEKTPDNIMKLQAMWSTFPDARFVNVIRDGRDGTVSAFIRFRSKLPEEMTRLDYARAYARGWSARIAEARRVAKGRPYIEVRYEALHADPTGEAGRLFAFLGADTGQQAMAEALNAASFESLSGGRKRGQQDATSHYRRGEVGGWADVLTEEEVRAFEEIAGPMMDTLGYARAVTASAGPSRAAT